VPQFGLHDVDDTAAFVAVLIDRSGLSLSWDDREDLEQHLLIFAWSLSEKYDPARGSFSNYLWRTGSLQVLQWQRKRFGRTVWKFKDRTHVRKLPELVSYDAERDSLEDAYGSVGGDPATVWDEACRGLYEDRDRERVRDIARLGIEEAA
jgi:hypothetical protein